MNVRVGGLRKQREWGSRGLPSPVVRRRRTAWRTLFAKAVVGVLILWTTASLDAQTPQPSFRHLSVESGLSHGSVHSIIQDRDGWMWFGTEDGLNRYDGYKMSVMRHDPSDPDSLASSNFGKIHQDPAGILWFGTWGGGLDRFDPTTETLTHFRHDPDDPTSLSENRIEFIFSDRENVLWVGTDRQGVNRFDPENQRFVRYLSDPERADGLRSDRVRAICEDAFGNLWLGTDDGLHRYDRPKDRFLPVWIDAPPGEGLASQRIRALVGGDDGALWIGTRSHGLHRWWIRDDVMDHFTTTPSRAGSLSSDAITRLFLDSRGALWIGTYGGGLNRFDPQTEAFTHFRYDPGDPDGLTHDRVESFWEDRSNLLWFGTLGGGVNILDLKTRKFRNITYSPAPGEGLPAPTVRAVSQLPGDPGLWVGTDGGGLTYLDASTGAHRVLRHDPDNSATLSNDRVWSLLPEDSRTLWVGTYDDGLNRLVVDGETYRATVYRHDAEDTASLSSNRVQALYKDGRGDLWIGTAEGLNRLRPTSGGVTFEVHRHRAEDATSLSHDYVITLLEDQQGTLWVGTRRGLNAFDRTTGTSRRFLRREDSPDGLQSNIIQALHEDTVHGRVLWVGTEDGGLHRLDTATETFRSYQEKDGLPSNVVFAIQQDAAGHLWLSTSRGLSRFDPESESFRNYDASDGLASHSFMRSATWQDSLGEMYFGSVAGLAIFHPDRVRDNPHVPPVMLTSFKVFNEELDLPRPLVATEQIDLSYRDNFFSIEFAALDFTAPSKNRYRYRLQGIDGDWVDSQGRTFANYTKVEPGRYTFQVMGSNNDGVWNTEPRSIVLSIRPPLWKTWWFRAAFLGLLALSALTVYRLRIRSVQQRNEVLEAINAKLSRQIAERQRAEQDLAHKNEELGASNAELERFTYTVSHDLKAPLVTIKGFLGFLGRDIQDGDTDRAHRDIEKIAAAADKMQRLLSELLELSRIGRMVNPSETIPLSEVVREAADLLDGAIRQRQVEVVIDPGMPNVWGDRLRLLQVFQNLLENAIKFMGEQESPRITIEAHRQGDWVVCRVQDNGVGIAPEHHEKIFGLFDQLRPDEDGTGIGLTLVRRIVEVHGGEIAVESDGVHQGSTFCITLPGKSLPCDRPDAEAAV